jgi:hypothetical protein
MSYMSGDEIHENFSQRDIAQLAHIGDATDAAAANYGIRSENIAKLANSMETAWQGGAAGAARRGAGPLEVEHNVASPKISAAAASIANQIDAFNTARASVVSVPAVPKQPGWWDNFVTLGGAGAAYEQQVIANLEANAENVRVMREYEAATERNRQMLERIPTNLNVSEPSPPAPPGPGPRPGGPGWNQPPGSGGWSGGNGGVGTTTSTQQPTGAQWSPSPSQAPPPRGIGLGQTHPDTALPLPPHLTDVNPVRPNPAPVGPAPAGSTPGLPVGPLGGGYGSGADSGRGGGSGGRGVGAGGPGTEGGRSAGRGGGPGARGAAGLDGGPGRGSAGAPGRGGLGRGGSGAGGGSPMGAGARGEGGEDYEHELPSFLVERDPEGTFGTDVVTAPSVIGE